MSGRHESGRRRLGEANPVVPTELPGPNSTKGQALYARIIRSPGAEPKRPVWRHRRALLVLVPAAVLALAAGYSLLAKAEDPLIVACFGRPSLDSNPTVVSLRGDDLLAACQPLWEPGGEFNPRRAEAPTLVACVLDGGGLGVFPRSPGGDTCRDLGLEPASGEEVGREGRAIQAVQEELAARFLGSCLSQEEASSLAQESLRRHGLDNWRVDAVGPFTDQRPCATLAFDPSRRTIGLVPTSDERST